MASLLEDVPLEAGDARDARGWTEWINKEIRLGKSPSGHFLHKDLLKRHMSEGALRPAPAYAFAVDQQRGKARHDWDRYASGRDPVVGYDTRWKQRSAVPFSDQRFGSTASDSYSAPVPLTMKPLPPRQKVRARSSKPRVDLKERNPLVTAEHPEERATGRKRVDPKHSKAAGTTWSNTDEWASGGGPTRLGEWCRD